MSREWSNLAKIIYRRTYARRDNGPLETWPQTVSRVIRGNIRGFDVSEKESATLERLLLDRKAGPAGRGLWFSGSPTHDRLGETAVNNCWFLSLDKWEKFVQIQDLLMLGGGVGVSVQHKYISKLPKVKKSVVVVHKPTKDADYIVPDSREGWCGLLYRVLEAFFVTGKSFSYSTICVRGYGEKIAGFGGVASGPLPLAEFVTNLCRIFYSREGKALRPIDVGDIVCATGGMVVAGNVRRSAIILLGDCWDKDYLKAKRWDLGTLPAYRSSANYSVVCDDVEDLHPLFWKTFENGEAFGVVNVKNIQKYGRMGELKADPATGTNPCGEATLEDGESCNLLEIPLMNLDNQAEFKLAAETVFRYGKRVALGKYHWPNSQATIRRNMRVGVGVTGCLGSSLFVPETLDSVYTSIQLADEQYSKELGVGRSIRTTTIKPSGTWSKLADQGGYEGIHAAYSRYFIQRVRFSSDDALIPLLKAAGHKMEFEHRLDGTYNPSTTVVDFYVRAEDGLPVADESWDTWKQLDVLKMAQKYWSDQSVSVSVYYKKDEIGKIKEWLRNNLSEVKTISFLCHSDHGYMQAPKEAITETHYAKLSAKVTPIDVDAVTDGALESMECVEGLCPVR